MLKLREFLQIIIKYFRDCINPDDILVSKRVNNANILCTILSWFVVDDYYPFEGIEPNYAGKIIRGEEPISKKKSSILLGKIDYSVFQVIWDEKELVDSVIDSYINDFSINGVTIRKGYECEDTASCLKSIYEDFCSTPKKVPIRNAKIINGKVIIGSKVIPLPDGLEIPLSITDEESPYIEALLRIYKQKEKKPSLTLEDLDDLTPFYIKHLNVQRDAFYSAESLRHIVREIFSDGIQAFSEFKDETFYGIQHLMVLPHKDGFDRLTKVISLVASYGFYSRSFLASNSGLVAIPQKNGILHILVNEERIDWVVDYDTDI